MVINEHKYTKTDIAHDFERLTFSHMVDIEIKYTLT